MKSLTLINDLVSVISEYLTISEFNNYNIVFPRKQNYILFKAKIISTINSRLLKYLGHDKLTELKNILKETGGIISGSFILQCVYDEYWEDSDIDIFAPPNKLINKYLGSWTPHVKKIYRSSKYKKLLNEISNITEFNMGGHKFQQIKVQQKGSDMYKYIVANFDLDICKMAYGVVNENGKEYLKIFNSTALMERTTKCVFPNHSYDFIKRFNKYIKRNIEITLDQNQREILYQKYKGIMDMELKNVPSDSSTISTYTCIFADPFEKTVDIAYMGKNLVTFFNTSNGNGFSTGIEPCHDGCVAILLNDKRKHIHYHNGNQNKIAYVT
ncbi:MAG: hypothetical protein Hyperionvirus3_108 [Hyperionvirus sp.]|uniref:Uncharacterized protein n=1 Tax=Hyperionvirus sp. TaxID=2487770 RepID=A0A3G5A7E3_9VIRU|nr:MAG: hypothetical protein Hyperionvirus3_108 [Hyperionvirus sp.]